jgi:hypothetical protein
MPGCSRSRQTSGHGEKPESWRIRLLSRHSCHTLAAGDRRDYSNSGLASAAAEGTKTISGSQAARWGEMYTESPKNWLP